MEIICFEELESTHLFMCEKIKTGEIDKNLAIYALRQTNGVGSRDNEWQSKDGNLHLNFCIRQSDLSTDLPLCSVSIYFGFIMKELLASKGSKLWLKWPNDLYIADKKLGGLISSKIKDFIVVGLGINLKHCPKYACVLDVKLDLETLIKDYINELEKKILWKQIFRKYIVEFEKSRSYKVHIQGREVPLKEALLYEDGSILLENRRVYNLR